MYMYTYSNIQNDIFSCDTFLIYDLFIKVISAK